MVNYKRILRYALISLFFFKIGYSNDYSNTVIKTSILLLQSNLSDDYASRLSASIYKHSLRYGIDWRIVVAIFKIESDFNMKAVNYKSRDFGIGQINSINMLHYKFDLGRQMTELDYAVNNTFQILFNLKEKYLTGSNTYLQWFTRYHSFTKTHRKTYYDKMILPLKTLEYKKGKI